MRSYFVADPLGSLSVEPDLISSWAWRAGLARLLIQCSSEDRQLVEGSYGEKLAEQRWTESYDFHCPGFLLRGHVSDSGRIDRRSGG